MKEQIRCTCKHHNIIAERDEEGNVYVQCRGCKEKVKIEPTRRESVDQKIDLNNKKCAFCGGMLDSANKNDVRAIVGKITYDEHPNQLIASKAPLYFCSHSCMIEFHNKK